MRRRLRPARAASAAARIASRGRRPAATAFENASEAGNSASSIVRSPADAPPRSSIAAQPARKAAAQSPGARCPGMSPRAEEERRRRAGRTSRPGHAPGAPSSASPVAEGSSSGRIGMASRTARAPRQADAEVAVAHDLIRGRERGSAAIKASAAHVKAASIGAAGLGLRWQDDDVMRLHGMHQVRPVDRPAPEAGPGTDTRPERRSGHPADRAATGPRGGPRATRRPSPARSGSCRGRPARPPGRVLPAPRRRDGRRSPAPSRACHPGR